MTLKPSTVLELSQQTTVWLLVGTLAPGEQRQVIPVSESPFRIGRRREMDLQILSPVVSGIHARILITPGFAVVQDCDSTNGTWVNGRRVTGDTMVSDGDVIEIGSAVFRITQDAGSQSGSETEPSMSNTVIVDESADFTLQRNFGLLLREKSLLPCYQSLHRLKTGEICGHEFLARSDRPGLQSAGQLFTIAERTGREVELSRLCRDQALRFSHLIEPGLPIFVNTHPSEELVTDVVPQMKRLRRQYPDRPMVVEIHEAAITDPALIRTARRQLADVDIRMAFDDFGRGQARIRELICAPSDYIKFDSALIADLQNVAQEQFVFFRSIIRSMQAAGAITVAEGVETEAMAEVCRDIGFDLVQGYLYGRPAILNRR